MRPMSRRNILRLAGGAGTSGLLVSGLVVPAEAKNKNKVRVRLSQDVVETGQRLTVHVTENIKKGRKIRVHDSTGMAWTQTVKRKRYQVWTATPTQAGKGRVTVDTRRSDGKMYRRNNRFEVTRPPIVTGAGTALIGMSAPAAVWSQRVRAVGGGLAARRIFADLAEGPGSQLELIAATHAAGMLPVVSYKVGGNISGAIGGSFDNVAAQAAAKLAAFGKPTAVTLWHEPHGDITPAQHVALQSRLLPTFKRGDLRVGPILNGWLLDRQLAAFAAFCPEEMFALWDWIGMDTYESGTPQSPGPNKPAARVPALSAFVRSRGHDLPLAVGEYNGFSPETIAAAGEALLSTPNVWFGCLWNSSAGRGWELSGDRLTAFKSTLADPRAGTAS